MDTGRAIIVAAVVLVSGYVLGNLHKLHMLSDLPGGLRINTITGTVTVCSGPSVAKCD